MGKNLLVNSKYAAVIGLDLGKSRECSCGYDNKISDSIKARSLLAW
jgi:hypothetical protein